MIKVPLKRIEEYFVETLEEADLIEEEKRDEYGLSVQSVQKTKKRKHTSEGDFEHYIVTVTIIFKKPADVINDLLGIE